MPPMPKQSSMQGPPGVEAYALPPQHMDTNMYIARMRESEYPQFMSFHMQQGMPHGEACARWAAYEHMKVESMKRGGACGVHM